MPVGDNHVQNTPERAESWVVGKAENCWSRLGCQGMTAMSSAGIRHIGIRRVFFYPHNTLLAPSSPLQQGSFYPQRYNQEQAQNYGVILRVTDLGGGGPVGRPRRVQEVICTQRKYLSPHFHREYMERT